MDSAALHLATVHLCLPLLASGWVLLLAARLWPDERPFRLGLLLVVAAAVAGAVAYYSGPGAHQVLVDGGFATEGTRPVVETHALWGRGLFVALGLLGAVALQASLQFLQGERPPAWQRLLLLAGGLILLVLLAWTAHLGGLVRHEELRPPVLSRTDG